MNDSTTIFLVNDDVRCIRCAYELPLHQAPAKGATPGWNAVQTALGESVDWRNPANYNPAHICLFKSFDHNLRGGEFVVVPTDTRWKFTVVRVIEVDVDFDPETAEQMKWIVGSVEIQDHTAILQNEAEIVAASRRALRETKRAEMRANLIQSHPEYLSGLKLVNALPYVPGGVPEAAPPPPPQASIHSMAPVSKDDDIAF